MKHWCISRGMSWDAINYISRRWQLRFEEIPVAGKTFYEDLAKIRPDWHDETRGPRPAGEPALLGG